VYVEGVAEPPLGLIKTPGLPEDPEQADVMFPEAPLSLPAYVKTAPSVTFTPKDALALTAIPSTTVSDPK
jgi:hypothetical protein